MGRGDGNDNPKTKYEKILRNVGIVLEQGHYSPKKIDDKFSKGVLDKYEDDLDPDKYIFYQKDIDDFKKYENIIATSGANGEVCVFDLRGTNYIPIMKLNGHFLYLLIDKKRKMEIQINQLITFPLPL